MARADCSLDTMKENRYLYNGKELDTDFGLNWYHYGARMYEPSIGRFTGVDPISDKFPHLSTFNYASNNPISNIDLHGLQGVNANDILNDPLFTADLLQSAATSVLDAIANTAISINDAFRSTESKANRIRNIATSQGNPILLSEFTDEQLASNIEVKFTTKGEGGYRLDGIGSIGEEVFEGLGNALSIGGVLAGTGGGPFLAARAPASSLRITESLRKGESVQVGEIARDMRNAINNGQDPWSIIPAVDVVNDNGRLLVSDGMHRVMAARFAGTDVKFNEITVSDFELNQLRAGASEATVRLSSSRIRKIMNNE